MLLLPVFLAFQEQKMSESAEQKALMRSSSWTATLPSCWRAKRRQSQTHQSFLPENLD
jgi:hypothetical protein